MACTNINLEYYTIEITAQTKTGINIEHMSTTYKEFSIIRTLQVLLILTFYD